VVPGEYLALLEYKRNRREESDRRIEELALTPAYRPVVDRSRCFRGIETHSAMVLATEIGDWRRFDSPRQLMAYLGLVATEAGAVPAGDRPRPERTAPGEQALRPRRRAKEPAHRSHRCCPRAGRASLGRAPRR
jgi:hypothetical protein